jgi:phosphatidyl-myo-inositol dimannoside synthase
MSQINNHISLSRKLRILMIASTYPRQETDYAVPWLRELVKRLAARGHQVVILAPSYEGLKDHIIDGVAVHRFRYSPTRWEHLTHEQGALNRIRNPWYQILGIPYIIMGVRAARMLARRIPFDIVHAHWPFPHGPMGSAAAQACSAPLVMTCYGAEFALARRKPWVRPLLRHSLQTADLVTSISSWTAGEAKAISNRDSVVLPFGSTVKGLNGSAAAEKNSIPHILFTGRLIQRKGVEYLLRAVPEIIARRPAKFVITGNGDQRQRLENLTHSLGIQSHVQFLGFVSNEQLEAAYASCDIWVNPAIVDDHGDTEGLGVGAIEAYMHHKPVVSTDVGGIPDVIKNGVTGLLVPQKNEKLLAEAILFLLDNPHRAAEMTEAGIRYARQAFDWDYLTSRLEGLYLKALAKRLGYEYELPEEEIISENRDLRDLKTSPPQLPDGETHEPQGKFAEMDVDHSYCG